MRIAVAASLAFSLGACAGDKALLLDGKPVASVADTHAIRVLETSEQLELSTAASLSEADSAQLEAFARLYRSIGHGPVVLEAHGDSPTTAAFAAQVRARLIETGVHYAALTVRPAPADSESRERVALSFIRYTAEPPDCPYIFEQSLARQTDNATYKSFGCANQVNLAAMIADPADLQGPRSFAERDGARRSVIFERWREGQPSHANRSGDERIGVSDALPQ